LANNKRKRTPSGNVKKRTNTNGNTGSKQFESSLLRDILFLVLFAISTFLFLCCFGVGGVAGDAISGFAFGLFGLLAYLVPWLLFIGLLVLISNQANKMSIIKFIAGAFFVISLCTFVWLVVPVFSENLDVFEYYTLSKDARSFGGLFGGAFAKFLCTFTGKVGAFIISILIIIVSAVIISEHSFIKNLNKKGKDVIDEAENGMKNARKNRELRKEERRLHKQEALVEREERWQEEKRRREEELVRRREQIAANKGNVTLDTKLIPPEEVPEQPVEKVKPRKKKTISVEESISSQNVTELIMPEGSEPIEQPVPGSTPEPEAPAHSFRIVENTEEPEEFNNPSEPERPVFTETPEEPVVESAVETSEELTKDVATREDEYSFPPVSLLKKSGANRGESKGELNENAQILINTLESFGVSAKLLDSICGPTVTRYELEPAKGVKVSKILGLADDIKLKLAAPDIRIEAPIPGKAAIGIEVPNTTKSAVMFGDLVDSEAFKSSTSKLTFAVGKDIGGNVIISDIAKMPHLLIAGATGSGKSVCLNTLIMSVLYKARPDEVKLIMIDPKVVELSVYNGIPHLMIPVVTDPKKAAGALNWAVMEMTNRYKAFADNNVRDIKGYNAAMEAKKNSGDEDYNEELHKPLPQILIAVDELADLMMVAPREVEDAICRLAQLARAAGIHLIIATQRPSVDVITGLIKANMPSRLALSVSSGIDSRTIIDMNGAEKLLGNGDMLFYPQGYQKPVRIQGGYISDKEVNDVAAFLKEQKKASLIPSNEEEEKAIEAAILSAGPSSIGGSSGDKDELFVEAAQLIIESDKASIGMLQRKLRIGFNRAARIMDQLADAGVVGPEEGTKPRTILMSMEQFEQYIEESF